MCKICEGDYDENTTVLDCSGCSKLEIIPNSLRNLQKLNCSHCPRLEKLPDCLESLKELYCCNCPLLYEIPDNLVSIERDCYYGNSSCQHRVR